LIVVVDFCLTLTDAVELGNTGLYGICCFYVGVSGGIKGGGIGVVDAKGECLSATALSSLIFAKPVIVGLREGR